MPREIRVIVFDRFEVAAALRDFLVVRREIEPVDQVEVVEIWPAAGVSVNVTILRGTARSRRLLRGPKVAAAMILFCLKHQIPVPHKAHKSLWPLDDGLVLSFSRGIGPREFEVVLKPAEEVFG